MMTTIHKVIIDFDDTLFHTYQLKKALVEAAWHFGFSKEDFWHTYRQVRDHEMGVLNYTFKKHARCLWGMHPELVACERLEAVFNQVLETRNYVFPDALPLLNYLKNQGKTLILLSLGEADFQRRKVECSGLAHFFDHIEFVDTHKLDVIPSLVDKNEQVYFLNDKARETKEILEEYPHWHALLKVRPDLSPLHYEQSGVPYFQNLSDIHSYLIKHSE